MLAKADIEVCFHHIQSISTNSACSAVAHISRNAIHSYPNAYWSSSSQKRNQMVDGHLCCRLLCRSRILFLQGELGLKSFSLMADTMPLSVWQLFRIYLHNSTSEDYETAKNSLTVFCRSIAPVWSRAVSGSMRFHSCSFTRALAVHYRPKWFGMAEFRSRP